MPERGIALVLFLSTILSILVTVGIIAVLLFEAVKFFGEVSFWEFITGTRWTPLFSSKQFGVLALVAGTTLTAALAMLVALPLGLLSAIYLSEYAPEKVRRPVKPILEVLAGIPTVVYGYFALLFVTPILRQISADISVFNALSASIVMGIMILPMVSSLSEDAMRSVPRTLREGAYALGSTKLEVSTLVVVPAALSGIVSAFILAASRAIGETMIVTIAAGQNPNFTLNPFVPIETMTAYIVQVSQGDAPAGSIEFKTIFAVALLLFSITLVMNLLSQYVVSRFREEYE
ncbi:MAG: phosphate ABC transporter permease subunit PstC [Chloroflexota bacterium]|nr:phosphate ABC transporter permease subunit PstC [Dehalococcoidia bacterium]MEC8911492.1 phosphate ABC transporter permease subunit PstC [Chloroflexota bacterium]MCS5669222.1 phosphate ABC transporter permease subunit PstC [Dehalococcoidia bacterium]MEC9271596.1 phosphate ABC transporter permease subunit PstC [Chloroflexota bacterium]MEC9447568.1 phosphate ABC transporter permease subunit PstC [Chloroflexota bacterium]